MGRSIKIGLNILLVIFVLFNCKNKVHCQLVDSLENAQQIQNEPSKYFYLGVNEGGGRYFPNSKVSAYILNDNMPFVGVEIGFNQFELHIKHYNLYGEVIKALNFNKNWTAGFITAASVTEFAFGYKLHIVEKFSITPFISLGRGVFSLSDTLFQKKDQTDYFYNPIFGLNADYRLLSLRNVESGKEKTGWTFSNLDILISSNISYAPNFYQKIMEINSGYLLIGLGGKMKFYFKN